MRGLGTVGERGEVKGRKDVSLGRVCSTYNDARDKGVRSVE